jgi:hypothetical protein
MDPAFHGGSNDTIGGRVRLQRPDLSRFAESTDLCRQYSLSSVKNLSAVSLTPAITFFPGVVDTGQE